MDVVWIDSWQQQCCGEDFGVGSRVCWPVIRTDDEWLRTLLSDGSPASVSYSLERHPTTDEETVTISGVVTSIAVLTYDLRPIAGERRSYEATPHTGRLRSVQFADKWEPEPPPDRQTREHFGGWIIGVEIATVDAASRPSGVEEVLGGA